MKKKRLVLTKETVRNLETGALDHAAGAIRPTLATCFPSDGCETSAPICVYACVINA